MNLIQPVHLYRAESCVLDDVNNAENLMRAGDHPLSEDGLGNCEDIFAVQPPVDGAGSAGPRGSAVEINRFESIGQKIFKPRMKQPKYLQLIHFLKRLVDIGAALFFFSAFGWLYLLIAFFVLCTSGAPVFYAQKRFGRQGQVFKLYKFRSMVPNAGQALSEYLSKNPDAKRQWADYQKLEKDPRVTKFGAFIRKTSLDELPQFWNVLIGNMSVVGPRPCMLEQKPLYGDYWDHYCSVRPGITGLWQVSGRNKLSYQARVAMDVRYVETFSIAADVRIFFKTVWVVATGHGSK